MTPIIILVCPQMAENIGMVARAMANFSLSELRLVAPRHGWPNTKAYATSSGAHSILNEAIVYETLEAALHDCTLTFALTARQHGMIKEVVGPVEAAERAKTTLSQGHKTAFIFGRERNGLESAEVGLADAILTLPVNPNFSSLNLAQAVLLIAYEYSKALATPLPFATPVSDDPAPKSLLHAFFTRLETALEEGGFFRPAEKKPSMMLNLRNIFMRINPSRQDMQSLSGAIAALIEAPKDKASASLAPNQAEVLRELVKGEVNLETKTPLRGLTRLLRRNPTPHEKALWLLMVKSEALAPYKFKRAIPIGPHIVDFVALEKRIVVEFTREDEAERHAWLTARNYRVIKLKQEDEAQVSLDNLIASLGSHPELVSGSLTKNAEKNQPDDTR